MYFNAFFVFDWLFLWLAFSNAKSTLWKAASFVFEQGVWIPVVFLGGLIGCSCLFPCSLRWYCQYYLFWHSLQGDFVCFSSLFLIIIIKGIPFTLSIFIFRVRLLKKIPKGIRLIFGRLFEFSLHKIVTWPFLKLRFFSFLFILLFWGCFGACVSFIVFLGSDAWACKKKIISFLCSIFSKGGDIERMQPS